jgi:penicillin-binding protein 1C
LLERCISESGKAKTFHSTLQADLQKQVDALLNSHVQTLKQNQINNACVLVTDIETGKIIAYVGNSKADLQEDHNYVDIIKAKRSTGSILKPFLYAFMMSENRILPGSLLEDVPTRIGAYSPKNFNLSYDGLVPANQAITRSLNVPAVKMLQQYGVGRFHQRLKQLGFTSFYKSTEHYGLSLILGGGEASLFEVASAYASMARALSHYSNVRMKYADDSYHPLVFLKDQIHPIHLARQTSDLLKASAIWYTFQAMTDLLRPQDYIGYVQFMNRNRIAWKTGTSFGFRDAWAVGLNGKYLVAVWAGNADGEGRPELTGTAAAAPLMFSVFNLLSAHSWFPKPYADLEKVLVCAKSGFKATKQCEGTVLREYPSGASRSPQCNFHQVIHLDSTGMYRVGSHCYPVSAMKHLNWFVATPLQEYFYKHHSLHYRSLPPFLPGCQLDNYSRRIEIVYPREGFSIYVPRQADGFQKFCVFSATHKQTGMHIYWHLDGEFIGETSSIHQLQLNPKPGPHELLISDADGETSVCHFKVLEKPGKN